MQLTPNYKLKKPEGTDQVDIQDFNDNADLIDAALKKKSDSAGGDISEMMIKTLDSITTDFPIPEAGEKPREFLGKVKKFFVDTKNWMTGVCLIGSIVNNCVTDNARLPLSAAQGKVLMDLYTVLNTNIISIPERPLDYVNSLSNAGHSVYLISDITAGAISLPMKSTGGNSWWFVDHYCAMGYTHQVFHELHGDGRVYRRWSNNETWVGRSW